MLKKSHTQQAEREDLFGHGVVWKRVEKKKGDESLPGTVQARILSDAVGPFPKMFTCMLWIPKRFIFESDRTRILRSFLLDLICDGALCEQDLRGVELASSHRLSCYVSFAHSQADTPWTASCRRRGSVRRPQELAGILAERPTGVGRLHPPAQHGFLICRRARDAVRITATRLGLQVHAVAQLLLGFGVFANHNPANSESGLARRNPRRLF